jgi:uncharacterized protein (DUF58 family)
VTLRVPEDKLLEFSKSIQVVATKVLEGLHSTTHGGRGVEYQSSSPFSAGEDIRFIDWKRYASTDRLYVNRYQREERSGWKLWIDESESMSYENKRAYGRLWVGSILYLAKAWGDPWWLVPDFSHSLDEAFHFLASDEKGEETQLSDLEKNSSSTDRLILVSDFFSNPHLLKKQIKRLEDLYHSVHLVQILTSKERDFKFSEVTEFVDLESSSKLILDAPTVRKAYLKSYENLESELKALVSEKVSFMLCMSEDANLHQQLIEFFESL